ncbi:hypothetical protein Glove_65g78 [Diversispora epigaea]|uniref:Uncharacterized protein n=1 Tax=Diversispora epigaea TaxID=1348612 RepID=A0A397JK00_9GLOM|nr:hypothetical protein Glove_65g78 [Diversispora epigaea]
MRFNLFIMLFKYITFEDSYKMQIGMLRLIKNLIFYGNPLNFLKITCIMSISLPRNKCKCEQLQILSWYNFTFFDIISLFKTFHRIVNLFHLASNLFYIPLNILK